MSYAFIKMHGIWNDFVILDGREETIVLSATKVQHIADRRAGVGCDQLIVMEASADADIFMRIYNADGSEVASCGNATRCVSWLLMEESGKDSCTIQTQAGLLNAQREGDHRVCVNMGDPSFDWQDIPLATECDTMHLDITHGELTDPAAASMGNPHMIFVVPDINAVNLEEIGSALETHPLFPERANVSIVQIDGSGAITQKVWERGAGQTLACGTAACAAVAALNKRGQISRKVTVTLPGGELLIQLKDGHVWMTGEVAISFHGETS